MPKKRIYRFEEILSDDADHIGEKGVKIAELKNSGISMPDGFVISSNAFEEFIKENNLDQKAKHLLSTVNPNDPNSLKQVTLHIYNYFHDGEISTELKKELYDAYKKLSGPLTDISVKVLPSNNSHSHSHKKDVHDEVKGEASLIHSIKDYWASNYSEFNITNFSDSGFTKALIIQKSIEPDKSGKIYTIDPDTYDKEKMIIKAMLGHFSDIQNLVSMPDYYVINKKDGTIVEKKEHIQKKAIRKSGGTKKTSDVQKGQLHKKQLSDKQIEKLINHAKLTEKLSYFPQEIDWIAVGENIYFIHTKPLTHIN